MSLWISPKNKKGYSNGGRYNYKIGGDKMKTDMTRRAFLKSSSLVVAATALAGELVGR